ncbi:hypothetical protein PTKIN_Ptkin09bG0292800 [Pterospermum kingtungense]
MATAQIHLGGRKPLQPKNNTNTNVIVQVKQIDSKPKHGWRQRDDVVDSNKENLSLNHNATTPTKKKMETGLGLDLGLELDSSLAEELSAIRKKLERLRSDKEETEKMLKEREAMLNLQMKDMEERGQIQKQLEMEVDRLFRLKELQSYCMRISPIKSLRERQQRDGTGRIRTMNEVQSLEVKGADWEDESVDENTLQSPAPSDSSEFVRDNNN